MGYRTRGGTFAYAGRQAMVIEQGKADKIREELTSRQDYESTLETLRRFSEMLGGKLVQPSGIVRRSSRGQWRSHPVLRAHESPYSSCGRGRAK